MIKKLLLLFLFPSLLASAQEKPQQKISYGAFLSADLSDVGFYGGAGATILYKNFSLSLSPVIDFSKSALPLNGPSGINTSVSYFPNFSSEKKINMYFNFDYKHIINHKNKLNEIVYGYGAMFKLYKNIFLCSNINAGFFTEKLFSRRDNTYFSNHGFNSLIKTSSHIRF